MDLNGPHISLTVLKPCREVDGAGFTTGLTRNVSLSPVVALDRSGKEGKKREKKRQENNKRKRKK